MTWGAEWTGKNGEVAGWGNTRRDVPFVEQVMVRGDPLAGMYLVLREDAGFDEGNLA
jgi:hypothetical protein